MRIKITMIVFFISTFSFMSCMKNDVSPGIEEIRSAYAELLKAKASAEITIANANAAFTNSQAAYQLALAELQQSEAALLAAQAGLSIAEADALAAQTERLRAQLLNDMAVWAIQLQQLELQLQKDLEAYATALIDAKNDMVYDYFYKYQNALASMYNIQVSIFNTQRFQLQTEIDLVNNYTGNREMYAADLAEANALLEILMTEYEAAFNLLGNVDAIKEKIADLEGQSATLMNQINLLEADKAELGLDCTAEEDALLAAELAILDSTAVLDDAILAHEEAAANFPGPDFWTDAITAVELAETNLAVAISDTIAPYEAWKDADDFINAGTDDLDGKIADAEDAIAEAELAIADLVADTLSKYNALVAADTAVVHKQNEIDAVDAEITALDVAIAAKQAEIDAEAAGDNDPDVIAALETERDGLIAQKTIKLAEKGALTTELGDLEDTADAALTLYNAAISAYNAGEPGFTAIIVAQEALITGFDADIVTRLAEIAAAEKALPDLWTELQHAKSYLRVAQEELDAALAAKEEVREAYEQYMDEIFGAYLVDLEAAVAAAQSGVDAANLAYENALLALEECQAPGVALQDQIDEAMAKYDLFNTMLGFYGNADNINSAYLAAFEDAIVQEEDNIYMYELYIGLFDGYIQTGEFNIAEIDLLIESLYTRLETYQKEAAYWKALLDEAIASAS